MQQNFYSGHKNSLSEDDITLFNALFKNSKPDGDDKRQELDAKDFLDKGPKEADQGPNHRFSIATEEQFNKVFNSSREKKDTSREKIRISTDMMAMKKQSSYSQGTLPLLYDK